MTERTGVLIKRPYPQANERLRGAGLREAGHDPEGYYLKIDCETECGDTVQVYIYLDMIDVEQVVGQWGGLLRWPGQACPAPSTCGQGTEPPG